MKNSGISINISGGNARIGDVIQGSYTKRNDIFIGNNAHFENYFEKCTEEIHALSQQDERRSNDYEYIKTQLSDLKQSVLSSKAIEKDSFGARAKKIYDNYAWAAKPIKEMLESLGIA